MSLLYTTNYAVSRRVTGVVYGIKSADRFSTVLTLHGFVCDVWNWLADSAGTLIALAAFFVAMLALVTDRLFRRRDALYAMLGRFEGAGFNTMTWHMEQLTRCGGPGTAISRVDVNALAGQDPNTPEARLVKKMLAQDWDTERAVMHEVYFFALRVHAWLIGSRFFRRRGAKELNRTFGYQLLSTLLDHRYVALRLQEPQHHDSYYPTQYGCLDPSYRDLVSKLAAAMEHDRWSPHEEIRARLRERLAVTERELDNRTAL
jgi:hypothetical protein